tara:strand:- start:1101 stop:1838 length:738 start_codon:yes stop_codon:yes gene_type:complete
MKNTNEWFKDWFNSPYYHLLYQNRDYNEADLFIKNLSKFLKIRLNANILDLACGNGRHSITLNKLGFNVTGLDLSKNSISIAKKSENKKLNFHIHDMRNKFGSESYEYIFNLFTSFGYFNSMDDNIKMLESIKSMLTPQGILIIDFLNAEKVIRELKKHEIKTIEEIRFDINKYIENKKVFKEISITDPSGDIYKFTERVQLFNIDDFNSLLNPNFEILHTFGDFYLNEFDSQISDRLIIIAQAK